MESLSPPTGPPPGPIAPAPVSASAGRLSVAGPSVAVTTLRLRCGGGSVGGLIRCSGANLIAAGAAEVVAAAAAAHHAGHHHHLHHRLHHGGIHVHHTAHVHSTTASGILRHSTSSTTRPTRAIRSTIVAITRLAVAVTKTAIITAAAMTGGVT